MARFRHLMALFITYLPCSVGAQDYALTVTENALPEKNLYIAFYPESAGGWEAEPSLELKFELPPESKITFPFSIASGRYAVRAFVDLDANGILNTQASGRPLEPFAIGIGNDRRRPSPSFRKSLREISNHHPTVELELRYPKGWQEVKRDSAAPPN
ncbi:DUF2141 domain-containing protein [Gilvimarinus sp. SDUM040013]|uniref:DUF2141 domain-containing protein n=1 Tax=Gilvimarinus gilvus TaxID=3058038 RepID=A0ABU4S565_9GAMM|nr:DUF2141 domain-containing protein [Gilvimarinus sp. SDUM040013]MDO3387814.1 DUF2141 domain-containing protein [Gilvimarinus sp. SDUM040013]MDX6851043.1 DUF2141 domain-containing protein [Gilvimarinus sp. SDUM040013]